MPAHGGAQLIGLVGVNVTPDKQPPAARAGARATPRYFALSRRRFRYSLPAYPRPRFFFHRP